MLNVSRTTIRTALQSLEQDGIINRKRAVGTTINAHVRPSSLALQRMVGFDGLLREKGYEVEVEVEWRRGPTRLGPGGCVRARPGPGFPDRRQVLRCRRRRSRSTSATSCPWANLSDDDFDEQVPASIFEFSARAWEQPVDHALAEIVPMVKQEDDTTSSRSVAAPVHPSPRAPLRGPRRAARRLDGRRRQPLPPLRGLPPPLSPAGPAGRPVGAARYKFGTKLRRSRRVDREALEER